MNDMTSAAFLQGLYARLGHKLPLRAETPEAFDAWRQEARAKLRELLSLEKYDKVPPLTLVYEWMDVPGGYVRERAVMQTEKEVWMPFFILRKEKMEGTHPAVILIPENGAGKFGTVWSDDYAYLQNLAEDRRAEYLHRWQFAFELADQGYLVVAPDIRGTGERREWMHEGEENFEVSSRRAVNNVAIALSQSLAGITVWEMKCLAEWLKTREDCSGEVALGGSGDAGTMALYCSAAEDCFEKTFVVNGLSGFAQGALRVATGSACTYVPSLACWLDGGDVAALIAPRPLCVEYTREDPLNGADGSENVLPQLQTVRTAYKALAAEDKLWTLCSQACRGVPSKALEGFL